MHCTHAQRPFIILITNSIKRPVLQVLQPLSAAALSMFLLGCLQFWTLLYHSSIIRLLSTRLLSKASAIKFYFVYSLTITAALDSFWVTHRSTWPSASGMFDAKQVEILVDVFERIRSNSLCV
jgi:hypothetical protein